MGRGEKNRRFSLSGSMTILIWVPLEIDKERDKGFKWKSFLWEVMSGRDSKAQQPVAGYDESGPLEGSWS